LKNNFKKDLLDSKVVDYRELYCIVAKRRALIPSFSIMVLGLNKDKFVFYKVSTSYKLIKEIEKIDINDIDAIEIKSKGHDSILNMIINKEVRSYFVIENIKDLYSIKKNIKK
jgi:hypothetical protein